MVRLSLSPRGPADCSLARLAPEISRRAYAFEIGKIALTGETKSLSEDPRLKKVYLGA